MSLKIIGTGFGRTGTASLKLALEELGFGKCYHMMEVFQHPEHIPDWSAAARGEPVDWDRLFEGYQSIVDWPGAAVWRDLAAHFPEARIIHTERPEDAWLKSFDSTIRPHIARGHSPVPGWAEMVQAMIVERVFGGRIEDDAACLEAYRRNSEEVRAEVPPEKLLVYRPGDGWEPLCAFLGVPVPDTPYPHENTTAQFQARAKGS